MCVCDWFDEGMDSVREEEFSPACVSRLRNVCLSVLLRFSIPAPHYDLPVCTQTVITALHPLFILINAAAAIPLDQSTFMLSENDEMIDVLG